MFCFTYLVINPLVRISMLALLLGCLVAWFGSRGIGFCCQVCLLDLFLLFGYGGIMDGGTHVALCYFYFFFCFNQKC